MQTTQRSARLFPASIGLQPDSFPSPVHQSKIQSGLSPFSESYVLYRNVRYGIRFLIAIAIKKEQFEPLRKFPSSTSHVLEDLAIFRCREVNLFQLCSKR